MTLTSGRGPLSPDRAGRFTQPVPDGVGYIEPYPRRVRAMVGDEAVIDSERAVLIHRPGHPPTYAFPADDVGDGTPATPDPDATGYVTVRWDAVDAWFEEDQPIAGHYPRNPYHRVDILPTSRHLRVEVAGTLLVEVTEAIGVFETALAARLYVPPSAVRMDLLEPSTTTTFCGYKGTASYWTAVIDGTRHEDVAWTYADPYPESERIRGLLCFDEQRSTVRHDLPGAR